MAEEYFKKEGEDFVKVEDPLHTQEDLDRVVKERADRIARQQFPDYDDLKVKAGKVDTISKEYEDKLKEKDTKVSEFETQLAKAKLETDKVKIVHEFKLDDLEEFVVGETVDEMRERAEKLSKGVGSGKLHLDKTPKPDDKKPSDSKKVAKKLFGGTSSGE